MGIYINYKMISAGLRNMMARNIAVAQNGMFAAQAMPLRNMGKKGKKAKKDEAEATVTEEEEPAVEREAMGEPVVEAVATPVAQESGSAVYGKLDKSLFQPWSAGNIPVIHSVEGHKCPVQEPGMIQGRYASVLFTAASQAEALYSVYEDMSYIADLHENSEDFRMFTDNQGVGQAEIK